VVNLTKYQILNQSGTSALGKANTAGQSILSLLQG
jgi:flagellin-like hook-associated protein FlgL